MCVKFGTASWIFSERPYYPIVPSYIIGIASAFLAPIQHAWAVILDSYFSNRIFERITTLVLLSSVFNILVLPFVFWLSGYPNILSLELIGIVAAISLIEVFYQYPYYWAFRFADTSVVTSLFSFGKIVVPIFAYLIVRERLTTLQYIGYVGATICATLLVFDWRKFRVNRTLWLMAGVSIMLSLQEVLYKYCFENGADWVSVLTWRSVIQVLIAGAFALGSSTRRDIFQTAASIKGAGILVILMQLLTWGGDATYSYALSLIPASVVSGIDTTQPIFVLAFASLFARKQPDLFREQLEGGSLLKKGILFAFIAASTALITLGGK